MHRNERSIIEGVWFCSRSICKHYVSHGDAGKRIGGTLSVYWRDIICLLEAHYLSIYYAAEKSANLTEAYPSTRILSKLAIQLVRRATVKWFMHARLATLGVSRITVLLY